MRSSRSLIAAVFATACMSAFGIAAAHDHDAGTAGQSSTAPDLVALPATLPDASTLPANVIQVSGSVPGMGEHWADPADLPLGPIYGVSQGKVIFLEFMIDRDTLAAGRSFTELASKAGIPLPPVDHMDIGWEPAGHEGFEVPHYDIHLYFITHAEHEAIRPAS